MEKRWGLPDLIFLITPATRLTVFFPRKSSSGKSGPELAGKVLMVLVIIRMCGNGTSVNRELIG